MDKTEIKRKTLELLAKAPLSLSQQELDAMELADFGLGHEELEGAQIVTLFNTSRIAAKIIALLPGQTLPEHRHVDKGSHTAKEEVLRVTWGRLYLYVDGPGNDTSRIPQGKETAYVARTLVELSVCTQHTVAPGTRHWLSAGPEGCVVYSFSSTALDSSDMFTDTLVIR